MAGIDDPTSLAHYDLFPCRPIKGDDWQQMNTDSLTMFRPSNSVSRFLFSVSQKSINFINIPYH